MAEKDDVFESEVIAENPMDLIDHGVALARLENTTQMQIARVEKRDETAILKAALEGLERYPEAADEALYSKPVGKDKSGKMLHVEGLSIRAAEDLANRWSNSAYGCEIASDTGTAVVLVAVWLDYESNVRHQRSLTISRYYKDRYGKMTRTPEDRFHSVTVPAAMSKLLRETILRSLPNGLKHAYRHKVVEVLSNPKTIANTKSTRGARLLAAFMEFDVTRKMIEAVACMGLDDFGDAEYTRMRGLYNAIAQGEITVADAFADVGNRKPPAEQPGPAVDNLFDKDSDEGDKKS